MLLKPSYTRYIYGTQCWHRCVWCVTNVTRLLGRLPYGCELADASLWLHKFYSLQINYWHWKVSPMTILYKFWVIHYTLCCVFFLKTCFRAILLPLFILERAAWHWVPHIRLLTEYIKANMLWGVTRWRICLRHCATSRKVAGSIPDGFIGIFRWHNPVGRTSALGLTQPLTEISTGNISWE